MTRKKLAILASCVVLVVAAVVIWTLGLGQSPDGSTNSNNPPQTSLSTPSQEDVDKKMVMGAAANLVVDITSGDPVRQKAAYSHNNAPVMFPAGTTIQVKSDTAQIFEVLGRVDATLDWSGMGEMPIIIVLEKTNNVWLIHHMVKVG